MTVTSYQNPILRGMYPDPSIVRVDDTYYMVNSTFEYYPGIALSKSTDLLNWTKLPGIARLPQQADLRKSASNEGIFAVCIRYHKELFYVITTNFAEFKNFIIRGKLSNDGESIIWEEKRIVVDIMGIDPDLYFEDDRTYIHFTGYIDNKGTKAIQQVEIELETGTILRGPEPISLGTGGRDVEGPHIIHQKGYYYLLAAEGGTGLGHMITMFRSKDLQGPYEAAPTNPLFTNRDRANEPIQNIGHADLFQDTAGNWWLTCLGTRPSPIGFTHITNIGRETLLYPVNWSGDWPVINNGIPTQEVDLTDFPDHQKVLTSPQHFKPFVDNFEKAKLAPEWVTLRDNLGDRLTIESSKLYLKGSDQTLSGIATPSFLALRQTEHTERLTVDLSKETVVHQGAVGLAVIINSDHYGALLVEKAEEGYQIVKVAQILDISVREVVGQLAELPSQLSLEHGVDYKRFSATTNTESISFDLHAQHFSNEAIAALNTGDFAGLYVLGDATAVISKVVRESIHE